MPNSNPPQTEKERLADILLDHIVKTHGRNLGQYRSEYDCSCGAKIYVDGHSSDIPNLQVAIALHVADFILERERALLDRLEAAVPENREYRHPMLAVIMGADGRPNEVNTFNEATEALRAAIKSEREKLG